MENVGLEEEVRGVFEKNRKEGPGYSFTCPALPKYPHQWLWDSCFSAIVLSKIAPERAKAEITTLLSGQREDGFLPSIQLWQGGLLEKFPPVSFLFDGAISRLTQPPVLAIAVEEIAKNTKDAEFAKKLLPKMARYYDWLGEERDPDGDNLVSIIHPWESTDDSPAFDRLLIGEFESRPNPVSVYFSFYKLLYDYSRWGWDAGTILAKSRFNVESVMFNSLYAQGLRSLARLSEEEKYADRADRVEEGIIRECWDADKELFFDISHRGAEFSRYIVATISSLFPLILDNIPREILDSLVKKHLINTTEFWLPYPVPFVSKKETSFNPSDNILLWRGPVWVNTNWFLVRGLAKHGYKDEARDLAKKTVEMVEKSGLWEFYNPFSGKGAGQKDYSWSGLVLDLLDYC